MNAFIQMIVSRVLCFTGKDKIFSIFVAYVKSFADLGSFNLNRSFIELRGL
jgi:hypothetical protein